MSYADDDLQWRCGSSGKAMLKHADGIYETATSATHLLDRLKTIMLGGCALTQCKDYIARRPVLVMEAVG